MGCNAPLKVLSEEHSRSFLLHQKVLNLVQEIPGLEDWIEWWFSRDWFSTSCFFLKRGVQSLLLSSWKMKPIFSPASTLLWLKSINCKSSSQCIRDLDLEFFCNLDSCPGFPPERFVRRSIDFMPILEFSIFHWHFFSFLSLPVSSLISFTDKWDSWEDCTSSGDQGFKNQKETRRISLGFWIMSDFARNDLLQRLLDRWSLVYRHVMILSNVFAIFFNIAIHALIFIEKRNALSANFIRRQWICP